MAVVIALVVKRPKTEIAPESLDDMEDEMIGTDIFAADVSHRIKRAGKYLT